jgi:hypothetical protein
MDKGRNGHPSRSTCKYCRFKQQAQWKRNHPKIRLLDWARHRAKINGWPFNICKDDFEIPSYCPVLGIRLKQGKGKLHDISPTLDRINPLFGYIPGNIVVISYKANRMKSNANLNELKLLVKWLETQTIPREGSSGELVTTNTLDNPSAGLKIESERCQ